MISHSRLKEIRHALRLNQSDMAERLGIKQSYYSALERGAKEIPSSIVNGLVRVLKVSPDWLYNANGDMFSSSQELEAEQRLSYVSALGGEQKAIWNTYEIVGQLMEEIGSDSEKLAEELQERASKLKDKTLYYYLRSTNELKSERPDSFEAKNIAEGLMVDSSLLEKFISEYIYKPLNENIKAASYEAFKQSRLQKFNALQKIAEPMRYLDHHLSEFFRMVSHVDEKGVLNSFSDDTETDEFTT